MPRQKRVLSKVLMTCEIFTEMSGWGVETPRFQELWDIFEDPDELGEGMYFSFTCQNRVQAILPEAKQFALRVRELLLKLLADEKPTRWIIFLNAAKELSASETTLLPYMTEHMASGKPTPFISPRGGRKNSPFVQPKTTTINLLHGVRMTVNNLTGTLCISDVAEILARAMSEKYKELDSPVASFRLRPRISVDSINFSTANPTDKHTWRTAIVEAYSNANTLEQMLRRLSKVKASADGWLAEVISLLETGDHVTAFAAMMAKP